MESTLLQSFLLLLALLWTSCHSEHTLPEQVDCTNQEMDDLFLCEGESLWFVPDVDNPNDSFTWFWNSSWDVLQLSSEETEPVHAHGPTLCVLNITRGRSGCFLAWEEDPEGDIIEHYVRVTVVPENSPKRLFTVEDSDTKIFIFCPGHTADTCQLNGTLSWYKDGVLLPGEHKPFTLVADAGPEDQGKYACVCTWTHHHQQYRSVGIRQLRLKEQSASQPVGILAPTEDEQLADAGASLLLNCTVLCGTNLSPDHCQARWKAKNTALNSKGYKRTRHVDTNPSKRTIVTQTLSIERVSAEHFREQFECVGMGRFGEPVSITVRLRARQYVASLAAAGTCVFLLFILMVVMVKCFVVDLVLLSRRLFPFRMGDTELKEYDAYVLYQLHTKDKPTEAALGRFVSQDLPHVLEDQYGYRLFIHGRDDLPGEDHVEQVEERMRKSRRLVVILTPDLKSEVAEMYHPPEGYDWQMGLHQALICRDLSVILIQLGDTGPGVFSHLPPALQHLIQRTPPIKWPEEPCAARANSRFWKRVRYLMPATPVQFPEVLSGPEGI